MIPSLRSQAAVCLFDLGLWLYWFPVRKCLQHLPEKVLFSWIGPLANNAVRFIPKRMKSRLANAVSEWFPGEYDERELAMVVTRSLVNYMGRRVEELVLGSLSRGQIARMVSIEGIENLEESVRRGKGTIVLLFHFGSFLMPLPILGHMGYPVNQLAGPPILKNHRSIHRRIFLSKERDYSRLPVTFLRTDLHLRTVLRKLRRNELVVIAFDGREGDKWVEVNFLNRRAFFSPGPVRMAQTAGSGIVPAVMIRKADHTHRLVFEKPFFGGSRKGVSVTSAVQALADIFEGYVRAYPCHALITIFLSQMRAQTGVFSKPIFAVPTSGGGSPSR